MNETQETVSTWSSNAFPLYHGKKNKAIACLEEAVELAMASGCTPADVRRVIEVPIHKEIMRGVDGDPQEECADLLSCVYAYAGDSNFSVHESLDMKMALNRSRPDSYYHAKVAYKQDLGLGL
jgi:hypothetical protein